MSRDLDPRGDRRVAPSMVDRWRRPGRSRSPSTARNLSALPGVHLLAGELSAAERLIDEDRLIAEATGNPPVAYTSMILAAWQGREQQATEMIQATVQVATARGTGRLAGSAAYASAMLDNGLSRHGAARDAARRAFERGHLGLGPQVVAELAEAAARTGDMMLVEGALKWMNERTRVTPTAGR